MNGPLFFETLVFVWVYFQIPWRHTPFQNQTWVPLPRIKQIWCKYPYLLDYLIYSTWLKQGYFLLLLLSLILTSTEIKDAVEMQMTYSPPPSHSSTCTLVGQDHFKALKRHHTKIIYFKILFFIKNKTISIACPQPFITTHSISKQENNSII